jgi:hypothetical protein
MRKITAVLFILLPAALAQAQNQPAIVSGPVGPSPYNVIRGWHQPFADKGYAFGGSSGVWAESPDRIFILQRGETKLPDPLPEGYLGFAGSVNNINVLSATKLREFRHCLYTLDRNGKIKDQYFQWDSTICEGPGEEGPGPHRIRISPYDPEHRLWIIQETFSQIYVLSNDGKRLIKTFGEKRVEGADSKHFGKPQDVAFLPDGRVLIADGLDNNRIMILDKNLNYIGEFGSKGTGPGQFSAVHAIAAGPEGRVFALDRSGRRINVFRTTSDPAKFTFEQSFDGFNLPLDIIVNDDAIWVTDLNPLRFNKLNFKGEHLYTWMVPRELPDGYIEVHTISVDPQGNLYGGDNQYGRTQKFVPKPDADPKLLIKAPWHAK